MPFSKTKVFLEETSLVARPIIPFPELKLRLQQRMKHLGIKVGGKGWVVVVGVGWWLRFEKVKNRLGWTSGT